jgi:prefoldin alpha subunit
LEKRKLASKGEEELRKLSVEMRFYEQTAETIQSRLNMLNAVITDLTYATMTLGGLEKEKENAELLVPIGGNSYAKAKLANPDRLIVGIGAGVSVEKTLPETKETIKKRLEELEKTRMSLQQQFAQVVDKINDDRRKFESLVAELREGKAPENV